MVNMGIENRLIACFNIFTRTGRKDAVKSIFDMLALIVAEEKELIDDMIEFNANDIHTDDVRNSISFLISAMSCLNDVYLDSEQASREHETEKEEACPF
jgi:hypothetical protein